MDGKYVLFGALIIFAFLYAKLNNLIFKAKDTNFVKDDTVLSEKQDTLKAEVNALKVPVKPLDMTPEEIEVYWSKNENK